MQEKNLDPKEPVKSADLFRAVADLATAKGAAPIKDYWECDIGNLKIGINGTDKRREVRPRNCAGLKVPPASIVFWWRGIYVGYANPRHVCIVEEKVKRKFEDVSFTLADLQQIIEREARSGR